MKSFDIQQLTRPNVRAMQAYSSARDEFKGEASIWLDANESPFDNGLNRYPDPLQRSLKKVIATWRGRPEEEIFLGNGSDEAIDLLFRAFCEPGKDKIMVLPPTYGMYKVSAALNDIDMIEVPLTVSFQPDLEVIEKSIASEENLKLIFICSPNNPTGNAMNSETIEAIAESFEGLVVVDQAYGDFDEGSMALLRSIAAPNVVFLSTFSKAFGLAAIRLGMAFGYPDVIAVLNKIKPPYNVNQLSQERALEALVNRGQIEEQVASLIEAREQMAEALNALSIVEHVYPSDANFLLVRFKDADEVYQKLAKKGIVLRNRTSQVEGCLRISVGLPAENEMLLNELNLL